MNDTIASIIGQVPSGLSILTARSEEGLETGMLASWVQQAAFDPPAVTVAVNKSRYLHEWVKEGVSISLNLLSDSQKKLLGHFGKGFEPGAPAFEGLEIERSTSGLALLSDSVGWLEGEVKAIIDAGDHSVFLVEIHHAGAGPRLGKERPWVHVRKNGSHY
ncbi:flavin reductase family protein [Planctomicrobium sp. SH668]|uniref:flavin reductase family protein n=1 Tax=Planctomicrobium sp. SH668 TaxID=3448126 RepID=UPI003F5CB45A